MADISQELQAILTAVYGEDVRGSIHDAIEKINDVSEVVVTVGTAVTGADSSTEGYFEDSLYLNDNTWDLWKCTGTAWALEGNIKGAQGIPGEDGTSTSFTVGTKVGRDQPVTFTDGTHSETIHIMDGQDGTGSTLASLSDVDISSPEARQVLRYNATSHEWENSDAGDLTGYNRTMSEADYRTLEAQSSQAQGTGVYDPDVYFFIPNVNEEGWVETAWLEATANSTTTLVFNAATIGQTNAASIHVTSRIMIAAEASDTMTMPAQGNNSVSPIYARVDYQDEGECQIIFDKQPVNTYFQLWIRND